MPSPYTNPPREGKYRIESGEKERKIKGKKEKGIR
jgi:hypothetical protein